MLDDVFTIDRAAGYLKLTPQYLRQLCQEGRLGHKIGRQWLITREELDHFQATRRPAGRPRQNPQTTNTA